MKAAINDSKFYMWRTLFSVAHADNVISDEEVTFMAQVLDDIDFSEEQAAILKDDIVNAKDPLTVFKGITEQSDRIEFFQLARDLVWIDNDFASEEQNVMIDLYKLHMQDTSVDDMVGGVSFELEEDENIKADSSALNESRNNRKTGGKNILSFFKSLFSK